MRVHYRGPIRGANRLAGDFRDAGFEVEFPPPQERHGGLEAHVVELVMTHTESLIIDWTLVAAVKKIVDKFKNDHPGVEVEIEVEAGDKLDTE